MAETENDPDETPRGRSRGATAPEDEALVVDNGSGMAVAAGGGARGDAPTRPPQQPATAKPKRTRAKAKPAAAKAPTPRPSRAPRSPSARGASAGRPPKGRRAKPRATPRRAAPRTSRSAARAGRPRSADAHAAAARGPSKRPAHDCGDNPPMVRAHAKYVRTSARKARLVCDHIRGKSVEEARAILAHANRDVARDWSKLLESAVANAEHNHELIGDELRIAAVKADEGPTLKRFRPRAMGRATKIRKRTSHLSITLTPKDGDN